MSKIINHQFIKEEEIEMYNLTYSEKQNFYLLNEIIEQIDTIEKNDHKINSFAYQLFRESDFQRKGTINRKDALQAFGNNGGRDQKHIVEHLRIPEDDIDPIEFSQITLRAIKHLGKSIRAFGLEMIEKIQIQQKELQKLEEERQTIIESVMQDEQFRNQEDTDLHSELSPQNQNTDLESKLKGKFKIQLDKINESMDEIQTDRENRSKRHMEELASMLSTPKGFMEAINKSISNVDSSNDQVLDELSINL